MIYWESHLTDWLSVWADWLTVCLSRLTDWLIHWLTGDNRQIARQIDSHAQDGKIDNKTIKLIGWQTVVGAEGPINLSLQGKTLIITLKPTSFRTARTCFKKVIFFFSPWSSWNKQITKLKLKTSHLRKNVITENARWRDMYQASESRTLTSGSTRWKMKAFKWCTATT